MRRFQTNETLREQSCALVTSFYNNTDAMLQPIYDVFRAESDVTRNSSDWAVFAQHTIADLSDDLQQRLFVNSSQNDIKYSLELLHSRIHVRTCTL